MIKKEDEELLKQFPPYLWKGEYVGTRDYWEGIFSRETNRDTELHKAFGELHKDIVDKVIQFCKKYDLEVDEFVVSADGILGSKEYGEWCAFTDSHMEMRIMEKDEETGLYYVDRDCDPFLFEI